MAEAELRAAMAPGAAGGAAALKCVLKRIKGAGLSTELLAAAGELLPELAEAELQREQQQAVANFAHSRPRRRG